MSQGVRLMAFWAKTAQNGETYHEGKLGGATVRLFVNGYKKADKDPDVIMYLSQTPFNKPAQAGAPAAVPGKSRITPRPQPQEQQAPPPRNMAPQKTAYVDHTQGGYGVDPQSKDVPWPDSEELPF